MNATQPTLPKQKLDGIQALRGVAVLLVLIVHLKVYEAFHRGDLLPAAMRVGNAGVDLFFYISGFVMVTVTRDKIGMGWSEAKKFWARRLLRIYPVYWYMTALALAVHHFFPRRATEAQSFSALSTWLLVPTGVQPFIWQGWSLMNELYFYAVFGLLLFCRKEWMPWLLLAWLGAILALGVPEATASALSPYPLLSLITHPMTAEFIAGCMVALYLPLLRRLGGWELFALGWALLLFTALYNPEPIRQERLLWYGVPCLFIFTGAVLGEARHQWRFPAWLVRIGDWSYSLYLCHVLFFGIASKLWPKVLGTGAAQSILFCLWLTAAALAAAWASYKWVETPLLKFCYRFTPK